MKYIVIIVFITFIFALNSCKDNTIVNSENEKISENRLVNVQVDLMHGFSGKIVVIKANKKRVYFSFLSETRLLSGPEAVFDTYIPEGENNLVVYTQNYNNLTEQFIDSARMYIGEKEKYFIGLQIADTLTCFVQDSSFWY